MQAYVRIFETVKVWVVTLESHYDQSLIYLESAQHFIVGTIYHSPQMCSFRHRISPGAFLQEHCTFCFDGSSLSVYLDRIRTRGISVRLVAVWCKK